MTSPSDQLCDHQQVAAAERVALEDITTNTLKRPLESIPDGEEGNPDSSEPKSKRQAKSASTSALSTPSQTLAGEWDITGKYEITSAKCWGEGQLETENYEMAIHHSQEAPRQLYANFKFDKLEGIMRMCPLEACHEQLLLEEFEKACDLDETTRPGPKAEEWLMRWRGNDNALPSKEKVGGEVDSNGAFSFTQARPVVASPESRDIEISFVMPYNGKIAAFNAAKKANVDESAISPADLKKQWAALHNPQWDEDDEMDSDAECSVWKQKRPKKFTKGQVLKARRNPGPPKGSGPKPDSPYIEELPAWAWNITGGWKVESPNITENLDIEKDSSLSIHITIDNNPYHTKVGRQLWATFEFGPMEGCIRFCPATDGMRTDVALARFEKVCILKDGIWPGRTSDGGQPKWNMRWRGLNYHTGTRRPSSDTYQTRVEFVEEDGNLMMKGVMVLDHIPTAFKARRVGSGRITRNKSDITVTRAWLQLESR